MKRMMSDSKGRLTGWIVIRLAVTCAALIVVFALVYGLRKGLSATSNTYLKLMFFGGALLVLATVLVVRQRASEWRDDPEKKRKLRAAIFLVVVQIAALFLVAFGISW